MTKRAPTKQELADLNLIIEFLAFSFLFVTVRDAARLIVFSFSESLARGFSSNGIPSTLGTISKFDELIASVDVDRKFIKPFFA